MERPLQTVSTELAQPYATALEQAVAFIGREFQPTGIIAGGTVLRGAPDPASDLDFAVLHEVPWRQRVQRRFNGVPAEIFVNSPRRLARTFAEEVASGRPVMLHMIATGRIVLDPTGTMSSIQETARKTLAEGPASSEESLTIARYAIATAFEDAEDICHRDPERAAAGLIVTMLDAARLRFRMANMWIPREKLLLSGLDAADPDLSRLIREVISGTTIDARFNTARQVVRTVTGRTGFFPWESRPQPD